MVTATTDGVDTVTITSNAAPDVMTMTCVVDQATVNGNLALPAMGCQDVTFVEVDAGGGMDTVNLGGVTQLAFPALRQTSIDVEDSSADSVTGSEARDVVHADDARRRVHRGRRRLGGGRRQRQRRRGRRHAAPDLRFRAGRQPATT